MCWSQLNDLSVPSQEENLYKVVGMGSEILNSVCPSFGRGIYNPACKSEVLKEANSTLFVELTGWSGLFHDSLLLPCDFKCLPPDVLPMSCHLSNKVLFIAAVQYEDGLAHNLCSGTKELAVPNPK